jgi:hypothetical protein
MRIAFVSAALVAAAWTGIALADTCTVTQASVLVKDSGFERPLPEMLGYAIPVAVDAGTGTIQFDFSAMPDGTFSISGVANAIRVQNAGLVTGSIDAGGNVALPPAQIDFTTALLPGVVLSANELLTTGIASVTLAGNDYATIGVPLDFTTGVLHLEGQGLVMNAPVVGTSTSGFTLTCTLAPIPPKSALPAAPSATAHAVGKPGKPSTGTVVGDTLTVKAKLKNGATPFDPTKDAFVRIAVGDTEVMVVRVPAGMLTPKGKKFSASDTDGSVVHLVTGHKTDAPVAGSLVIAQSKKGMALTLKQSGVDATPLTTATSGASATATITMGQTASDGMTVKPGAKKTVLK